MTKIEELEKELTEVLDKIKHLSNEGQFSENYNETWEKMVDTAHELHKLVKPRHHKYMIENRIVDPNDREFYNHIHPVEDLLAFIKDPHANDDPEDQTLNHDFELEIYTRRWGHPDKYKVKRVLDGWHIGYMSISGNCDKSGKPYLYNNFRQDSVNYPESLPGYLEWLWEQASEEGLTHEKVQEAFDYLGKWISDCEKNSPKGIWEAYK